MLLARKYSGFIWKTGLYSIIFLFLLIPYADSDWGWHYRYGEYFFQTGKILRQDIFSSSMPGYAWINHSWLYDIVVYLLYSLGGFPALIIAGAVVGTLIFAIVVRPLFRQWFFLAFFAPIYLSVAWTGLELGLRAQTVGLLFFSVFIARLVASEKDRRKLFAVPLLFFLWANFHGSFLIGVVLLMVYALTKRTMGIVLASIIATLVNPFGWHIYEEGYRHVVHPLLSAVVEWHPPTQNCPACHIPVVYALAGALSAGMLIRRKVTDIPWVIMIELVLAQSLIARRYLPFFAVVSMPYAGTLINDLYDWCKKPHLLERIANVGVIVSLMYVVVIQVPKYHVFRFSWDEYCTNSSGCSVGIIDYLQTHELPRGPGFTPYDWGGYLIGRKVPMKTFVDGRMHLWEKYGYSAYRDFLKIYVFMDRETIDTYNFSWILGETNTNFIRAFRDTMEYGKWTVAYEDPQATLLVKEP